MRRRRCACPHLNAADGPSPSTAHVWKGEKQTVPILDGLKSKKYDEKHIHILNDVKEAFPLINKLQGKETYVLLENDLPDIFNE